MQSLLEQTHAIANLAAVMNAPSPPCSGCNEGRLCSWHRFTALAHRRMNRAQWHAMRTEQRERAYQREQQARDEENWREQNGYPMPYSARLAAGHEVEEADID